MLTCRFSLNMSTGFRLVGIEGARTLMYVLVDRVYPDSNIFAKPISVSKGEGEEIYKKRYEGVRKDIER